MLRVLGPVVLVVLVVGRVGLGRLARVTVRGESMTPTLRPGDQVIIWRQVRPLRAGQVVIYRDRHDERLRVKRVASIDTDGLLAVRGDNAILSTSERELAPVVAASVLGVGVLRKTAGRRWTTLEYDSPR